MNKETPIETPIWISDHEDIRRLLSSFLDKVEKGTRPLIRLTPKSVPSLFDYNNTDSSLIWTLIQMLEKDFHIITVQPESAKTDQEIYDNAKVHFNPECEELVRRWLDRPKHTPYKDQWRLAVNSTQWTRSVDVDYLRNNPITYVDKAPVEVAESLCALEKSLEAPKTLRSLSATHFWGDSKFLDNRQEYLESAFPHRKFNIQARPILVNIFIPDEFSSVLFIENQDTFLMMVSHLVAIDVNTTAIVYTAGYRGTATRIRDRGSYVFSTLSLTSNYTIDRFTSWWEKQSTEEIPAFFWGDLDYSGLGILSALRGTFRGMTAWRPGYELMRQYLSNGISHPTSLGNKGAQTDPRKTGCTYSDEVLLPAVRKNEMFVDQEIVTFTDIDSKLF
jgi:hypothetical protein